MKKKSDDKNNSAYEGHFAIFLSLNYFNFNLNVIKDGASTRLEAKHDILISRFDYTTQTFL